MYQTYSILQKLWLFIKLFTPMCITQFSLIGATFIAIFLTGQYSTTDLAGVATDIICGSSSISLHKVH